MILLPSIPHLGLSRILPVLLLVVFFLSKASPLLAQRGAIKGIVKEQHSGTLLSSASVSIDSLRLGTLTDVNGSFLISNLPAGTHTVRVSFLTYEEILQIIQLEAGEILELTFEMTPIDLRGETVIITAQALGQTQAINEQLNSDAIANMVSADRIQELPDVNAAEAIARLPGIALNRSGGEGQKVVIRGLEPKFAQITINGVSMPANDAGDRSVDLSLIAPELLDGIEVFKSPLPDMDAESVGGTVNLKLRRAPKDFRLLAKGLGGFNELNNDLRDHKGILQMSNRLLENQLGVVFQAGLERFNRGGDIFQRSWRQGRTNDSTGITEIWGNDLRLEDRQEIRRRYNTSLGLDYELGRSQFSFFGLYSRTTRDRFEMQERYDKGDQLIRYYGQDIESFLDLLSLQLTGMHNLGPVKIDWTVSDARSRGQTPYHVTALFEDYNSPFDPNSEVSPNADPALYLSAAQADLIRTRFRNFRSQETATFENTRAATLNFELPYKLSNKIFGSLKFGGKYKSIQRERDVSLRAEQQYYLATDAARRAISAYNSYAETHPGANPLVFLPQNNQLISFSSFVQDETEDFEGLDGEKIPLSFSIDPEQLRYWYESQQDLLNNDRSAAVDNYEVNESVSAAYMMLKFQVGEWLTVIPGFRYEYSDNEYSGVLSTANGIYGVNGFIFDTTTYAKYGEFLPHLHLKIKPSNWFDIRASYAKTLARPDFSWISPGFQINQTNTTIQGGNSDLRHMVSTNYDLVLTAYKGGFGLISAGVFRKDIENVFYPWQVNLDTDSMVSEFNFPGYRGYTLSSYRNSPVSRLWGYEFDLQTTLSFLPKPLSGLVFNFNYARLFSYTQFYYLTVETELINPFPPIFQTIFTSQVREVGMRSQAPHILRSSLGYDYKGFSVRVSAIYQSSKPRGYNANPDFDTFDLEFWRIDASLKQLLGEHWSLFLNLNNLNNQQDVSFVRNPNYLGTIETYGITGTLGLQYRL